MNGLRLRSGALVLLLCACPVEGGSDDGVGATEATETVTSDAMTEPTGDPSMTSVGTMTAPSTMTTEVMTTDGEPSTTAMPETTTVTTDVETDTGEPMCAEPDPSVDAMFVVDVGDWPFDSEYSLTIDAPCTIASLSAADPIDLELACDHDGTPRTVAISAASTSEGAPQWPVDLPVTLHYRFHEEWELENRIVQRVAVRDAESGDLLLAAADTGELVQGKLSPFPSDIDPIGLEQTHLLDCGGGVYDVPLELEFSLGDEVLALQAGQRGVLAIAEASEIYAIDLAAADGIDPDEPNDAIPGHIELVVRRVAP